MPVERYENFKIRPHGPYLAQVFVNDKPLCVVDGLNAAVERLRQEYKVTEPELRELENEFRQELTELREKGV